MPFVASARPETQFLSANWHDCMDAGDSATQDAKAEDGRYASVVVMLTFLFIRSSRLPLLSWLSLDKDHYWSRLMNIGNCKKLSLGLNSMQIAMQRTMNAVETAIALM